MGRSKQTFLQRRQTGGQKAHEKMLNIINYQRTANQNCNEVSPHTCQNVHHQKIYHKCWKGCEEKGTLLYCRYEYKFVQPLWRTVWRILKKLKLKLQYDPALPFLGVYLEKIII